METLKTGLMDKIILSKIWTSKWSTYGNSSYEIVLLSTDGKDLMSSSDNVTVIVSEFSIPKYKNLIEIP